MQECEMVNVCNIDHNNLVMGNVTLCKQTQPKSIKKKDIA